MRHERSAADEVPWGVAEPAGFAVVYHLTPAAAVVHDEDAAAGHGLKADTGPVFRGVGGLQDDVALAVEVCDGEVFMALGCPDPGGRGAGFFFHLVAVAQEDAFFRQGGGEGFIDGYCLSGVFLTVHAGDVAAGEGVCAALFKEGEVVLMEIGAEGDEAGAGLGVERLEAGLEKLSGFLILEEEEGYFSVAHGALFLVHKPCHAAEGNGAAGVRQDVREVGEEELGAEAQDGVFWR